MGTIFMKKINTKFINKMIILMINKSIYLVKIQINQIFKIIMKVVVIIIFNKQNKRLKMIISALT